MLDSPLGVFALSFVFLWISAQAGAFLRRKQGGPDEDERQDLGVVLTASLTLLGLVIGFTFSMALTRYDQRKNCEKDEANAIGTEYLRAALLPGVQANTVRSLLAAYLAQRVSFYTTTDALRLAQIRTPRKTLDCGPDGGKSRTNTDYCPGRFGSERRYQFPGLHRSSMVVESHPRRRLEPDGCDRRLL
jgi:hypothetical protein